MAIRYVVQTILTFICFWITGGLSSSNCTVYDFDGKNRSNVFECESPGIINCKVTVNSAVIQWFIADPIEPSTPVAAQCFGSSCTPFNDFSGRYVYTYNQGDGIANITIKNISSADRGLKYKINDGTLQQIFEPITKVFPEKITASLNFTDVEGSQNVTVSTDCTLLAKNITFVWQKTRNSSGAELEPLTQEDVKYTVITTLDDTHCASTHTCGKIIFSSTLMFKPGMSGDAYYLHCTVVVNDEYGPPNKIWVSSKAYQFKDFFQSKHQVSDGNTLGGIIGGSVGGGIGFLVILVICCCLFKRGEFCNCRPGGKLQKNDTDYPYGPCCNKSFKYCPQFRVHDVSVSVETIVLHTVPRETSITCTWHKEFKGDTEVRLSYTNTETLEKCDKTLTVDEKQKRSCTIRNLQPGSIYSLVMKASDIRNRTIETSDPVKVQTLALKPPKTLNILQIEVKKVKVSWEPALSDKNQIFCLIFYPMSAQDLNKNKSYEIVQFVNYETPLMEKIVTGLQKNTLYQFEIFTLIGTRRSISLVDFVHTTGTKYSSETQHTEPN